MKRREIIRIRGIVQGVGFRPFLFRVAKERELCGFVLNDDQGVLLEVEGAGHNLEGLVDQIREEAPPLSRINDIKVTRVAAAGHKSFEIRESPRARKRRVPISPDAATCPACLEDILDVANRRYRYPFTNCTHCGPRLTIVMDVPYDRSRTTMAGFNLCGNCRIEYEDPKDRRFHAQPNACPTCGPQLWLMDAIGIRLPVQDPLAETRRLLIQGAVLAMKGLGGFHLACDARNELAVRTLRERKVREEKPFALMARDLDEIESCCEVDPAERRLLASVERPIVILRRRADCALPDGIAPRQNYLGFMLPYTPLHHLLFHPAGGEEECPGVLVMTSGNRSDEPIAYRDEDARERMQEICDYFLMHDRPIHLRCDDSITRVFRGKDVVVRRARGYVPRTLPLHPAAIEPLLAVGALLKNTFALARGEEAIIGPHIGDLENLETYRSLGEGIIHFCRLFDHEPKIIVHDLHPDYLSTRLAMETPAVRRIGIQHHEAHIAAVLSEHGEAGPVIGVAFDGTGYGHDGTLWGGEFFVVRGGGFERAASLMPILLPGGEAAIREPWRIAYGFLSWLEPGSDPLVRIPWVASIVPARVTDLVSRMLERRFNSPWTTGAGRYFDAVGAILLRRGRNAFEGQVPMDLEMLAGRAPSDGLSDVPWKVVIRDRPGDQGTSGEPEWPTRFRVDLSDAIRSMLEDLRHHFDEALLARRFHRTIAEGIAVAVARLASEEGVRRVALGGGVFQNQLLLEMVVDRLIAYGLEPLIPSMVPANDGGISYGQLAAAAWRLRTEAE
jgi:hydrogenase maturation protein HypF